jgi:hypothetical protein
MLLQVRANLKGTLTDEMLICRIFSELSQAPTDNTSASILQTGISKQCLQEWTSLDITSEMQELYGIVIWHKYNETIQNVYVPLNVSA